MPYVITDADFAELKTQLDNLVFYSMYIYNIGIAAMVIVSLLLLRDVYLWYKNKHLQPNGHSSYSCFVDSCT
jgi:hypothetical protein